MGVLTIFFVQIAGYLVIAATMAGQQLGLFLSGKLRPQGRGQGGMELEKGHRHAGQAFGPECAVDREDPVVDAHAQDDDEADGRNHVDRDTQEPEQAERRESDESRGKERQKAPLEAPVPQLEDEEDDDTPIPTMRTAERR